MQQFEIAKGVDGKEYLSFTLSVVERAHAYDEAVIFETCDIALRLMPDNIASFTEIDSLWIAVGWTIFVLAGLLAIIYKKMLPFGAIGGQQFKEV
jgi:hypothetical protein